MSCVKRSANWQLPFSFNLVQADCCDNNVSGALKLHLDVATQDAKTSVTLSMQQLLHLEPQLSSRCKRYAEAYHLDPQVQQMHSKTQNPACNIQLVRGWNKHVIRSMLPSLRTKASGFAWQSCYSTVHIRIYMYWYHDGTRLCDNVTCTLSFIILWSTYFTHIYVWLYCVHDCVMLLVLSVAEYVPNCLWFACQLSAA